MLQKTFYKLLKVDEISDNPGIVRKFHTQVELMPSHPIFAGHFPGNPIVPGVCQVEMIREIVMEILEKPLFLGKSDNIKFLSMINPLSQPVLDIDLDLKTSTGNETDVTALIKSEQSVFLKFKGTLHAETNS
jgi:3-hydroxyacyl-[acyl-carrier-protein] dehydratase